MKYATFYYDDGSEIKHSINIGWFFDEKDFYELIKTCKVPDNWIRVKICGKTYKKQQIEIPNNEMKDYVNSICKKNYLYEL